MFKLPETTPQATTWNRGDVDEKMNPLYYVKIAIERRELPHHFIIQDRVPANLLFQVAPALQQFLQDGNEILLPGGSADEDAIHTVVSIIIHHAKSGKRFDMCSDGKPVTLVNFHRVFALFAMNEAKLLLPRTWDVFQKEELKPQDVVAIWEIYEEWKSWPDSHCFSADAMEYVQMMAWQLLDLAAEGKINDVIVKHVIEEEPDLKSIIAARKQKYGLAKGYEAPLEMGTPVPHLEHRKSGPRSSGFRALQLSPEWTEYSPRVARRKALPQGCRVERGVDNVRIKIEDRNQEKDGVRVQPQDDDSIKDETGTLAIPRKLTLTQPVPRLTLNMQNALNREKPVLNLNRAGSGQNTWNKKTAISEIPSEHFKDPTVFMSAGFMKSVEVSMRKEFDDGVSMKTEFDNGVQFGQSSPSVSKDCLDCIMSDSELPEALDTVSDRIRPVSTSPGMSSSEGADRMDGIEHVPAGPIATHANNASSNTPGAKNASEHSCSISGNSDSKGSFLIRSIMKH